MANRTWIGAADAVKQVDTTQVTAFDVTTTYIITINGDTVSVLGVTDADATAAALQVALEASTNPYFVNIDWTVATDTVTGTAGSAGNAHTFTSSVTGGAGTIGAVASVTANTGPNNWDNVRNWAEGTVPVSTDDVIIENSAISITQGLDQSAVTLTSMTIQLSFTGRIGLRQNAFSQNADGSTNTTAKDEYKQDYLQIGCTSLDIGENFSGRSQDGSTLIKIDLGSVLSGVEVHETASGSFDPALPAVQLLGTHASNTLSVRSARASIGIAVNAFEVSTFLDIDIGSDMSAGGVILGSGVTLTNMSQKSGTHFVNAAGTITLLSILGGILTSEGSYTVTTVDVGEGSSYFANHISGGVAITTLNFLSEATVDTTQRSEARTFTTVNLAKDANLIGDTTFLTVTNLILPSGPFDLVMN